MILLLFAEPKSIIIVDVPGILAARPASMISTSVSEDLTITLQTTLNYS